MDEYVHDAHAAARLWGTRVLAENRDAWLGIYIAVFQQGEEKAEGARAMVEGGLSEWVPRQDVALSQHVMPAAAGTIGTVTGRCSRPATRSKSRSMAGAHTARCRTRRWTRSC